VDPARIVPVKSTVVDPHTIGYAGSLLSYEGLDTLIDAVDALARRGHPVKVELVGEGEARPALEAQVRRLGLSERIRFHGRVSPEKARETVGRFALVCIPRKPLKVCEIVPPIKMIEALAMGKPVIVPDLPVLRDEMGPNPAGWFFTAGDPAHLAQTIESALVDRRALSALGERAREYASTQRCWRDFVINALPDSVG
jgi:glycosyltransferase involved in cell wall biosynthesis